MDLHQEEERVAYNYAKFDIFLSHSGEQKPFVRELYKELGRVNHTRVFFDEDSRQSLPRGSHLATNILSAIQCCKVGVVVISQGFIKSLWPMMELEYLMQERKRGCIIYPIFYNLQPGELVKQENLNEWQKHWENLDKKVQNEGPAGSSIRVDISTWAGTLKFLAGTIIPASSSSCEFLQIFQEKVDEIVCKICELLPPPIRFFDNDLVKGKERTVKRIEDEFKVIELQRNKKASYALVLGVAGIGGSGKTTLCKTMVDHYWRYEMYGRSTLLEFPTHEIDMQKLIQDFKKAITIITMVPSERIKEISDINEAISFLKQANKTRKFFLAIDNIWEWSKHYVLQILFALISNNMNGFVAKVIVTSRSESILSTFTRTIVNVPELTKEEAIDILLSNSGCQQSLYDHVVSDSFKMKVESLVDKCFFNCAFHPLLLETLGKKLGRANYNDNWEQYINGLENICFGQNNHQTLGNSTFQNEMERIVFKALEVNYKDLQETLKHMFVDIAILYPRSIQNIQDFSTLKGYNNINLQILELQHFGLLKVLGKHGEETELIEIHDLYRDLARREAQSIGQFLVFIDGVATIVPSSMSLSKVTRIVSCKSTRRHRRGISANDLKGLDFSPPTFDKLEYLDMDTHDLNVLFNAWKKFTSSQMPLGHWVKKVNVTTLRRLVKLQQHSSINLFSLGHCLSILKLECGDKITRLDGLCGASNLQILELNDCYVLREIRDIGKLKRLKHLALNGPNRGRLNEVLKMPNLNGCTELVSLRIRRFGTLKRIFDLQCPHSLQSLDLFENSNLVDVGGIGSFGENLVSIVILYCDNMKVFPNLVLPKVESITMSSCSGLEAIMPGGALCDQNFPSLEIISITSCGKLKVFPRVDKPSKLKEITVNTGRFGLSFGNANINLQDFRFGQNITSISVTVHREQFVVNRNHFALSRLPNLEFLRLEVVGRYDDGVKVNHHEGAYLYNPCVIQFTNDERYAMSPALPFLSQLTSLRELELKGFDFIRSLEELSCLTNLQRLHLEGFNNLERLPHELSSPLTKISIIGYARHLESMNLSLSICNFEKLTNLRELVLEGITSLENLLCNDRLDILYLTECSSLRMLPNCLKVIELECPVIVENLQEALNSCTTSLNMLTLYWPSKPKITDTKLLHIDGAINLSHLTKLTKLTLKGFPPSSLVNFFKWPPSLVYLKLCGVDQNDVSIVIDLTGLTSLRCLEIIDFEYLQSLRGVSFPMNLTLFIGNCRVLEGLPKTSWFEGDPSVEVLQIPKIPLNMH